jgi:hypothetical protein
MFGAVRQPVEVRDDLLLVPISESVTRDPATSDSCVAGTTDDSESTGLAWHTRAELESRNSVAADSCFARLAFHPFTSGTSWDSDVVSFFSDPDPSHPCDSGPAIDSNSVLPIGLNLDTT